MKTIKVRPVLIESKEPTNIFLFPNNKLFWNNEEGVFKQLIFISLEDDKIKEGDLFYTGKSIKICAKYDDCLGYYTDDGNTFLYIQPNHRKVITLQPQIPTTYIQQFIEEYNKGEVKDVKIEMEKPTYNDWMNNGASPVYANPKLTDGFVTIVNNRLFNESDINKLGIKLNIQNPTYTEEEVLELLYEFHQAIVNNTVHNRVDKWFEQNKKK